VVDDGAEPTAPWLPAIRIAFGAILLIDAILEYQTGTYQVFVSLLYSNASVSPEPLRGALVFAAELIGHQPAVWNAILAATELVLGLGVMLGLGAAWCLVAALPLFAGIWVFGQGLGLPFAAGTTDLNSGPLYILLSLVLLLGRSWRKWSVFRWVRPEGSPLGRRRAVVAAGSAIALAGVATLTWGSVNAVRRQPGVEGPPAVGGAALAFDAQTNQDVFFGGCDYLACSGATWLWDGHRWLRAAGQPAPPEMGYAGAAYSGQRRAVVLFGGATEQGLGPALDSTWVWNGRSWSRLKFTEPPPGRRFPAIAYDPSTKQLLMFGGDDASGKPLAGTYVLTSSGWRQLRLKIEPSARTAAAMAWDPGLNALLLYGGSNGSARLSDTWAWTGQDWTRLSSRRSPGPLAYIAMSTDPTDSGVLLYAGAGASERTWRWGRGGWTPVVARGQAPPVYSFMAMAPAPSGRGVLLVGGATSSGSGFSAQAWLWNGSGWNRLT
jgi:hypothetical protein